MKTWNLGYNKSLVKAKKIYRRIGRIKVSALGDYVYFTNIGFNHLVRKGRLARTKNEQKRRFVLIPLIEEIIKDKNSKIEYRETEVKYYADRYGNKTLITSKAFFWTFVKQIGDCEVKVVTRKLNDGDIHFFSVMGNNVKISSRKKRIKNKKLSK